MGIGKWWRPLAAAMAIAVAAAAAYASETITYTYDSQGRIVKVERSGTINDGVKTVYQYDKVDNRSNVTVTGSANTGTSGNDTMYGTVANDTLYGLGGNDWFYVHQGGDDAVYGGDGYDLFLFRTALTAADLVDGGAGSDQLALQGNYFAYTFGASNLVSVESMVLLSSQDNRFGGGSGSSSILFSYNLTLVDQNIPSGAAFVVDGSQLLAGETLVLNASAESNGTVSVHGGSANDTLIGGTGNDLLVGRIGADRLTGGLGADTFRYTAGHSSASAWDTIVGINDAADRIDLPVTISGFAGSITGANLSSSTLASNLATAVSGTLGAGQWVKVTASSGDLAGRTFLVADADGVAGFNSATDYVIEVESPVSISGSTNIFI